MTVELVCTAHSPIMACYAKEPDAFDEIEAAFAARTARIAAYDPELVVVFGTDHFNGVFLSQVPPFSVGLAAEAVDDIGGHPGTLTVPADTATALIDAVRADGVDVAASHAMTIDHGFTQPMQRLLGALDRYPVIPIYVNGIIPPFVPFKRSRLLGEAVGRFLATRDERVLILGSGGMSHHPTRYYPAPGEGPPEVAAWQAQGETGSDKAGGMTHAEWLERLRVMHLEGAEMLVSGQRTREDIYLNPEFDRAFLDTVGHDALETFDAWRPEEIMTRAGIGSLELHTWIAACAANRAAGGAPPVTDVYADTLEYGIGFGLIHAGAA